MGGKAGDDGKNWLLIKQKDNDARPGEDHKLLARKANSVLTGRSMDQIAEDADRVWSSGENGKAAKAAVKSKTKAKAKQGGTKGPSPAHGTNKKPKSSRRGEASMSKAAAIAAKDVAQLDDARRAKQPTTMKPQLALLADTVPTGETWLHELKFDGYRMLAFIEDGKVRLVTRNGNDWSKKFPTIVEALQVAPVKLAILDGEIVSLDKKGLSNFQQLQNLLKRGDDEDLVYYVFDLPHCQGYDLRKTPLGERKELLARLVRTGFPQSSGPVRFSDHIAGSGQSVLDHACQLGMEGIVCKRADSRYVEMRSSSWLKVKCLKRQEFVIGGYTKPTGSRVGFGALLLGYYERGKLHYCGKVGTGFTNDSLRELKAELSQRQTDLPPFENPPTGSERRGVTWVKPELVGEVAFTEWTGDGQLRHPSFQGLREDKSPKKVVREEPGKPPAGEEVATNGRAAGAKAGVKMRKRKRGGNPKGKGGAHGNGDKGKPGSDAVTISGVTITHPDRVLYSKQGITKGELAAYYEAVAEHVLPHVVGRPLTLVRCPQGSGGPCFYQKHVTESMPDTVHGVSIREKGKSSQYVVVDDLVGLIALVQLGVLEFHPWPATAKELEKPDRIVFDLDPGPGVGWKRVIEAAREVRAELDRRGLESFVRTSGGKGLHVVVPIEPRSSWDEVKAFAKDVTMTLSDRAPNEYVAVMTKSKRPGKIFIDYLRNGRGATAIASYSTRAREGATVSMPLTWAELGRTKAADQFNITNTLRRLKTRKADPWKGFFKLRQSL